MVDTNKIKKLRELTNSGILEIKEALIATNDDIDKAIIYLREKGIIKATKKANRIAGEGLIEIFDDDQKLVILELNSETDFVASNKLFTNAAEKIAKTISEFKIENFDNLNKIKIDGLLCQDFLNNLTSILGEKITLRRFKLIDKKANKKNEIKINHYLHSNKKIGTIVIGKKISKELLKDLAMHVAALNPEYLSLDKIPEEKKLEEIKIAKKELEKQLAGKKPIIQEKILAGKINKNFSENTFLEQKFIKDNDKKIKEIIKDGEILEFIYYKVGEGIEKKQENFAEEINKQINSIN